MSEEEVVQETQDRFKSLENEASKTSLKLESITDGFNARGIPTVRFVDDIGEFATSFSPLASAELLIGAYSDLFAKFKSYEESLSQKRIRFQQKIPEIEKSLTLVKYLKSKQAAEEVVVTRYNLADTLFAKAELECNGTVNLWLGANVMLEYTYDEAIELLSTKEESAKKEYENVRSH
jgi:prefoldin subunit 5